MKWFSRFAVIGKTVYRYDLLSIILDSIRPIWLRKICRALPKSTTFAHETAPVRLRLALESLGPIFVKLGQVLSTRPDILPPSYAVELARLQDKVPPFEVQLARQHIEQSLGRPIEAVYARFDDEPTASASVAQVHYARLHNGDEVAVKILRPNLHQVIEQDLALMRFVAVWVERLFADGKRLRPREVVAEFDKYLHGELDLMREAANASQLHHYFSASDKLIVPRVYFDYCTRDVLTIQWMDGIPISDVARLRQNGIDLSQLARLGVEIFFTQVFEHGFFHADMHPGNIRVALDGRYIALDFGIVGSLTEYDKRYLAINFLAFFNRDYRRVATAHIESGWVPPDTRVEDLEAAVRAVCEPIFNKPLSEISFGLVLMRLFETSRRFHVEIQPQLILLQKTLLNIEGLGRQLDPNLDLWDTAKPFLVRWMHAQVGPKALWRNIRKESSNWAEILPALPRKINEALDGKHWQEIQKIHAKLLIQQRYQNFCLAIIAMILLMMFLVNKI